MKFRSHLQAESRSIAVSSEVARRAVDQYGVIGSSKGVLEALCRQMAADRITYESQSNPLARLVSLKDIAQVVHFLCVPASGAIIGQTFVIDKGKVFSALIA